MAELTDTEKAIIVFARDWYMFRGAREQAIRDTFDMTTTRYFQHLTRILDRPEAEAFDVFTVRRLRRYREQRQLSRSVRRA